MKEFLYEALSIAPSSKLTKLSKTIYFFFFASEFSIILETEPTILHGNENLFLKINYVFATIFFVEYIARLYAVGLNKNYSGFKGRIKYIFSFYALIDLIAFAPFLIFPAISESFLLRVFRVFRLFTLLRANKHFQGLVLIGLVIKNKSHELFFSITITFGIIFISAVILYIMEGSIQPNEFGSIPRSLWWAAATLTTIGAGDVMPTTVIGKILTTVITIASIGIVAIPTSILAAGFYEALNKIKDQDK